MTRYHDFETRWREYDRESPPPSPAAVERLRAIEKAAGPLLTLDRVTVNDMEAAALALRAIARADAQGEP